MSDLKATDGRTGVDDALARVRADSINRSDEEKVMAAEIERLRAENAALVADNSALHEGWTAELNPSAASIKDWHVEASYERGSCEVRFILSDANEARGWAAWLLARDLGRKP